MEKLGAAEHEGIETDTVLLAEKPVLLNRHLLA